MDVSKKRFIDRLQAIMGKFSSNIFVLAIANGMIKILPITMVGSICAIFSNLGISSFQLFIDGIGLTSVLKIGTSMTTNLISIYVLIALSYEMANNLKNNTIISILLSVMSFFIVTPLGNFEVKETTISAFDISYLGSKGMFVAMLVGLFIPYMYFFLVSKNV